MLYFALFLKSPYLLFLGGIISHGQEMSLIMKIKSIRNIFMFITLYLNIHPVFDKHTHGCYWRANFFYYVWIIISQISTFLSKIQAYHLKKYVVTWFHILIWIIFYIFFVTHLDYILFLIVCDDFLIIFEYGNILEYTVSWFPGESTKMQTR